MKNVAQVAEAITCWMAERAKEARVSGLIVGVIGRMVWRAFCPKRMRVSDGEAAYREVGDH